MEKYIQRFHKKTLGEYNERPTTLLGDARDDYLVHLQPEFDWLNEQIGEAKRVRNGSGSSEGQYLCTEVLACENTGSNLLI